MVWPWRNFHSQPRKLVLFRPKHRLRHHHVLAVEGRRGRSIQCVAEVERFGNAMAKRGVIPACQQSIAWKTLWWCIRHGGTSCIAYGHGRRRRGIDGGDSKLAGEPPRLQGRPSIARCSCIDGSTHQVRRDLPVIANRNEECAGI